MSKAWIYYCHDLDDGVMVFFADNASQAKAIAHSFDAANIRFIDIRVRRVPELDHLNHDSGYEMDWSKDHERIELMKIGLTCIPGEYDPRDICRFCDKASDCHAYDTYRRDIGNYEPYDLNYPDDREAVRNLWVRNAGWGADEFPITGISRKRVKINLSWVGTDYLLKHFVNARTGYPCGKRKKPDE